MGQNVASLSDFINENLIPFRYGTMATVTLLTVYGLSNTPMFFRYKTISDIPSSCFIKRQTLHGRIVRIVENDIIHG
jgi:hypothetical protein